MARCYGGRQRQHLDSVAPAPPAPLPPPPQAPTEYDYSNGNPRKAIDNSTDCCAKICGLILLVFALTGVTSAWLSMFSCRFLDFTIYGNNGTLPPGLGSINEASLGLFQYLDAEDEVCYFYDVDSTQDLNTFFRIARLGIVVAVLSSSFATLFLILEYCFFRICCSRVLINLGLICAILGIPMAFAIFTDSRCYPLKRLDPSGSGGDTPSIACEMGEGGISAIAAGGCFVVTLILTCVTPKPIPFVRLAEDLGRNGFYDNCCSCWPSYSICGRRRGNRMKSREMNAIAQDEGEMEKLTAALSMSHEMTHVGGHSYKQYHDENAGYTLQNQYTAAYKRWLAFEADYEEGLGRFKRECAEADVNWRVFMRKANDRKTIMEESRNLQKVNTQVEGFTDEISLRSSASVSTFRTNNQMEDLDEEEEEDIFLDDELLRFVDLLTTMRANCEFAKDVMSRIQNDINEHTRHEDERQAALEKQIMDARIAEEISQTGNVKKKRGGKVWKAAPVDFHSTTGQRGSVSESKSLGVSESMAESQHSLSEEPWTTIDEDGDLYASARMNPKTSVYRPAQGGAHARLQNDSSTAEERRPSLASSPLGTEASTPSAADRFLHPVAKFMDGVQNVRPNFVRIKMPTWKRSGSASEVGDNEDAPAVPHNRVFKNPFRGHNDDDGSTVPRAV